MRGANVGARPNIVHALRYMIVALPAFFAGPFVYVRPASL